MASKLEELRELKTKLKNGGGKDAVEKQHSKGKMTARERLMKLFDDGTFVETGIFIKNRFINSNNERDESPADGVITGYGQIDGRLVYATSQDFTVVSGAFGEMHANKIIKCQEDAIKMGAPIIFINDSNGIRIEEGIDALAAYGKIIHNNSISSGVIPQISVIMGTCAGAAVYSQMLSDFVFMVDKTSHMFLNGSHTIKNVTDKDLTMDELGGANVHGSTTGVVHYVASSEDECIMQIKNLLSYLPQNNLDKPEEYECNDDLNRVCKNLDNIVESENSNYSMKEVITTVADNNMFFECQKEYAKNVITGFMRLGGHSVGIVANEPTVNEGCIDSNASDKIARFIRMCDCFNIPLITFEDSIGFVNSVKEEHNGIMKHGAKILSAYSESTIPMVTVITKKAYGSAYVCMGSKPLNVDLVYAWPSAEISIMKPEGIVNVLYENEIKQANNADDERNKKIKDYKNNVMSPYLAASHGLIDDIIEPSNTRKILIQAFESLATKVITKPRKKHNNMPL